MKPLRFSAILKKTLWGGEDIITMKHLPDCNDNIGESWEISGVPNAETLVTSGEDAGSTLAALIRKYRGNLMGKANYARYGETFPLLVKFISNSRPLSVQVHPDDEMAHRLGHPCGKTEMWYVVDAQPGASVFLGFNHEFSKEGLLESLNDGTLMQHLASYPSVAGDCYFIPAGCIHSIGSGNFVIEIQQTSDDTFRVYDFDRVDANGNKRQLHIAQACEALNFKMETDSRILYSAMANQPVDLVSCREFTTRLLQVDRATMLDYSDIDSFVIYIVYEGGALLEDSEGNSVDVVKGQSVLFPAQNNQVKIFPNEQKGFACLETFIK